MWTRSCDFSKKRWKLREGVQSPTFDDNASKQMNTINATDTSWRIFKRGRKRDILDYLWLSPQNVHLVKHEIYQLETGLSHFQFHRCLRLTHCLFQTHSINGRIEWWHFYLPNEWRARTSVGNKCVQNEIKSRSTKPQLVQCLSLLKSINWRR